VRRPRQAVGSAATEYVVILGLLVLAVVGAYVLYGEQTYTAIRSAVTCLPSGSGSQHEPRDNRHGRVGDRPERLDPQVELATGSDHRFAGIALVVGLAVPFAAWHLAKLVTRLRKSAEQVALPAPSIARPTPKVIQARAEAKRQELWRAFVADRDMLLQNQVRVRHLMTREVLSVPPEATRSEVVEKFQSGRVSHLIVCDESQGLLGVISDRDLYQRMGNTAAEVMTADVVSVAPDTTISSAVSLLIERRISSLPVVDKEKVCGVITATDLLLTLQCALQMWLRASQDSSQPPDLCEGSGLASRNELENFLAKMLAIRAAHGHAVSVLLAAFGGEPLAGPRLMGATWLLAQHVRETDLVAYLGENRFGVVMPHTELDLAEKISDAIQESAAGESLSGLGVALHVMATAPQAAEEALDVLTRCESLVLQTV